MGAWGGAGHCVPGHLSCHHIRTLLPESARAGLSAASTPQSTDEQSKKGFSASATPSSASNRILYLISNKSCVNIKFKNPSEIKGI